VEWAEGGPAGEEAEPAGCSRTIADGAS